MKSFSRFIFEVAQPSERGASEEQAFKDQHTYEVMPHPVALDHQHTGEIQKPELAADGAARRADQKGDANYDQAYKKGNSGVFAAMESVKTKLDDALSDKQKKLDHNNNGKIDGHDLAQLRKGKVKKDLEELSPAKLGSYVKKAHDDSSDFQNSAKRKKGIATATNKLVKKAGGKPAGSMFDEAKEEVNETTMSAMKKPVRQTGPDGKTRTVMKSVKSQNTDDHGQDKIITNESILMELEENMKFKMGNLRLKNGKSVKVSKQDADLLNQMFKDLNPVNRRKLGAVAIKDPAGFEEIVGFAREAL